MVEQDGDGGPQDQGEDDHGGHLDDWLPAHSLQEPQEFLPHGHSRCSETIAEKYAVCC